jgi:hypothetical protein
MTVPSTAYGPQIVADQAKALVLANWSTVCTAAWQKAMGAPNLPAPVSDNVFTSLRTLFTAESQPAIGLSVSSSTANITDALGAMDQLHELQITVCSDWGYYDGFGVAQPLVSADPGDPAIEFTAEVYETALRAYVEGIVMILCSATYGFINLDLRNSSTPNWPGTGIYNASPSTGVAPQDFVVGMDDTGQSLIQQTVRASIQVYQRRSLAG